MRGRYRPYKDVLRDACRRVADGQGWDWSEEDQQRFVDATRSLQPFPDAVPVLERLRTAGLRLAVLSNCDRELMAHALGELAVPIDVVVTAEDARAYKPSERFFAQALERIDEPPDRVLHVAFGFHFDVPPAHALGLQTAWVNRRGEPRPGEPRPDYEWRTLWELADLLGS